MHIVTASDDNYAIGVLVLIASARRHNPGARFTVLADRWSADSVARIEALARRLGCPIDLLPIPDTALAGLPLRRHHVTAATYARLFIPQIVAACDRFIYMDCDMAVTGSLDDAWNAPLGPDHLLAAVPCPTPSRRILRAIGLSTGDYFNAGFLVADTQRWRDARLPEHSFERLRDPSYASLSEDEYILNDLCRDHWLKLPSRFNLYAIDEMHQPALEAPSQISVVHYITSPKPWVRSGPIAEIWQYEADRIADLLPTMDPRALSLRKRISIWNKRRKVWMGYLAGKKKYRNFRAVRRLFQDRIIPTYRADGDLSRLTAHDGFFVGRKVR